MAEVPKPKKIKLRRPHPFEAKQISVMSRAVVSTNN